MTQTAYTVFVATYGSVAEARMDYDDLVGFYRLADLPETFDSALIAKGDDGTVTILARRELPARHGAAAGSCVGLAVGIIVGLVPGVIVPASLLLGATGGAAAGALAWHVRGGMSHTDLGVLGEILGRGQSGIVAVAEVDIAPEVGRLIDGAEKVVVRELRSEANELETGRAAAALPAARLHHRVCEK